MKFKLPDSIFSKQDLSSLIIDIKDYARWFSHHNLLKNIKANRESHAPDISSAAIEILHSWSYSKPLNQERLAELIDLLENYKNKAESIDITLAEIPNLSLKKNLVNWCRENISPNILVNFHFNAIILGGLVVQFKSHIFDWSFRRQILEAYNNFPEVLRRV